MTRQDEVRRVTAVLAARHPLFAEATVERLVRRTFDEFAGARVTAFVPVLVQRIVGARLRDLDRDHPSSRAAVEQIAV